MIMKIHSINELINKSFNAKSTPNVAWIIFSFFFNTNIFTFNHFINKY